MNAVTKLLADHMDIWTAADAEKKSGRGRASVGSGSVYGIKKLRELILELAVRGKLVPQDPNDEPASELLRRIEVEKENLFKNGKIKKGQTIQNISKVNIPFDIPRSWKWVKLTDVYYPISVGANKLLSSEIAEFGIFPVVDQGQKFIAGYTENRDLLIEISEPVIVFGDHTKEFKYIDFSFVAGADGVKILCPILQYPRFFFIQLCGKKIEGRGYSRHYKILNDTFYALPPIEEQHRIVAKVDELMALCDQLEAGQAEATEAHEKLVGHLLDTLTTSDNAEDFAANWHRISAHFDTLFTTQSSIDALKQTILQLAVMGKLVPQVPNDEPANKQINKILHIKNSTLKGKSKNSIELSNMSSIAKPFKLPRSWEWIKFGDIALKITDGTHHTPTYVEEGIPFLSVKDMSSGELDFSSTKYITPEEHEILSKRCKPEKGDLLLTKIGTTGVPVVIDVDIPFSIFVSVALIKAPWEHLSVRYLKILIAAPFVKAQSTAGTEGVGNKNLVLRKIQDFLLAIPPLAEQHRIVARVDELTAMCDLLKDRLGEVTHLQQKLADVIVEQSVA